MLVGVAEAIDHARRMGGKGIDGREPAITWSELIEFKRGFTDPVPPMKEKSFAEIGIEAYHGRARFVGPRAVGVGAEVLEGRFVLIAAGAVPAPLGIPGDQYIITSTEFLELSALPPRMVLVGEGYIAPPGHQIVFRPAVPSSGINRAVRYDAANLDGGSRNPPIT